MNKLQAHLESHGLTLKKARTLAGKYGHAPVATVSLKRKVDPGPLIGVPTPHHRRKRVVSAADRIAAIRSAARMRYIPRSRQLKTP